MSHPVPHPGSEALPCFDHQPRTRVVFGADSIDRAGELARELGAKKVLLVTDPGIVAAGHAGFTGLPALESGSAEPADTRHHGRTVSRAI